MDSVDAMTSPGGADVQLRRTKFFINGQWVKPLTDATHTAVEAATGEALGVAALGAPADVKVAVEAAREALDNGPWGRTSVSERAALIREFADALERRSTETATTCSRENGMPIATATGAALGAAGIFRTAADLIENTPLEQPVEASERGSLLRREPVGVVGAITPWNFPQPTAALKVAPALAAGCTIVLKHSPDAAFDTYVFADIAQEIGLPPGVLNIVLGDAEAGRTLVTHPDVDKIAFTGSSAAGSWVAGECGRLIRRVTLELGGKSAAIVCDDADMTTLYNGLGNASFPNSGQTCTTQSRILAPRSRYEEVVETVEQFARDLRVGDPLDPETTCGPMAAEHHLAKVMRYIGIARDSGARLVTGGGRPADLPRGWFVEPTIFADVDNSDQIAREEVFGPVIVVIPYEGDDEAVRIANDTDYGLAGSVWSTDRARGLDIARRIRTGTIGINNYDVDMSVPFGGMKSSGLGREHASWGIDNYLEFKSVFM
ncbi:aldehyde dehydrogenase [Streptomyces carpinensis]|uniref:Aldehyde dehydrogenase n=1 Tax=Streptomyces carpinensis TaxID=66369 RepID=A0ABV1VUQ4_9ACTN|nr:aldehyde dehydrogenase [Streptomyces carpinensis]